VNGATDRVIEFVGPVVAQMSMEARMTLCNMAIEAGGTCGICLPPTRPL
jgi:3-isopropylmalate/(R)-2-methylmalate dehydratase large subunit